MKTIINFLNSFSISKNNKKQLKEYIEGGENLI
jgi:hypothetical protein|nr:MAG TPA: protein of unknown function (DUF4350) [Crassvirales sp.]